MNSNTQYLSNGVELEVVKYCQRTETPCRSCGKCACAGSNSPEVVRFSQEVKDYNGTFQADWNKRIEKIMDEEQITRVQAVEELLKIENEL